MYNTFSGDKIKSVRRIVETVIGQLDKKFGLEIVWARDGWHLMMRIARKLLTHTVGAFLNKQLDKPEFYAVCNFSEEKVSLK